MGFVYFSFLQSDTYFCMSMRLPVDEEAFVSKYSLDSRGRENSDLKSVKGSLWCL